MKIIALALTGLVVVVAASPSGAQSPTVAPKRVFSCSFGAKQAVVTGVGNKLVYQFGLPGKPEMTVSGDPTTGNVHYHNEDFAHAENKQLRFQNGKYSYVLFNRFSTPDYGGKGAEDTSGLVVMEDAKTIARLKCKTGEGFSTSYNLSGLPDDDDAHSAFP